jgi:hypothetical protein
MKSILIDFLSNIVKLRYDLQAESDFRRGHFVDLLVEVDDDQALFDIIDPAKFLGDDAFEVGRVDLRHQLDLSLLVDFVVHIAIEQVVDFLLIQ